MSLSEYVHAMGRGPSRGRSLTLAESKDAMTQILAGTAAPEAVGALLMLMRFRGETAEEVAGFTSATRAHLSTWQDVHAALDWPSYAAGRSRGLPWFLLSAKLLARAGHRVLLHGWNSHQNPISDVRTSLRALSIPVTGRADCAQTALQRERIAYVPLESLSPRLLSLLRLRDQLGLRSVVNTVCRMLNPSLAQATVQGVFHPSYRGLQQDAASILKQSSLMVLKGGGGEFERHPGKTVELYGLRDSRPFVITAPARVYRHRRLADADVNAAHLVAVWEGEIAAPWAEEIVIGTAAAALIALDPERSVETAEAEATSIWKARKQRIAA